MLLSDDERVKFADYLEIDADSSEQIAAQMDKLGTGPTTTLAKQMRVEAAACRVVAKKLRAAESMSIAATRSRPKEQD